MFTMGPAFHGVLSDPYFANVVALSHFNESAGTTSPGYIGKAGVTIGNLTPANNKVVASPVKAGAGAWGFSGADGLVYTYTLPSSQPYTLEFFYQSANRGATGRFFCAYFGGGNLFSLGAAGGPVVYWDDVTVSSLSTTGSVSNGVWYHFAICYSGGTVRVFQDGVQIFTSSGSPAHALSGSISIALGHAPPIAGSDATGYFDDFRWTHGTARYSSAFTPPSAPFPDA